MILIRPLALILTGALALASCLEKGRTIETLDPAVVGDAQSRLTDGILREEDVRGGTAGGTVGDQVANLTPTDVARLGSAFIEDYVSGSEPLPATMPAARREHLRLIYAEQAFEPLWFDSSGWTARAKDLMAVFKNATVDGLLPRDYMPGEQSLPKSLKLDTTAVAQIDLELTAGLLRYIRDAREGRYSGHNRLNPVPLAKELINARFIDEAMVSAVNQGELYQELRRRGLQEVQYLTSAQFDAYRVTMEQLRAKPIVLTEAGKYLISNIAVQEVVAMRDGHMELGMNMVVGRRTRATPIRDDGITNIKFSPDWTAPKSIVRRDLIPRAPGILQEMQIQVLSGSRAIDPTTIRWTPAAADRYIFRQNPGPHNVLGGVRFTLQNSSAIYMHDSPERVLFNKPTRTYSSGCMRLESSAELALWLLKDQDPSWTLAKIQEKMNLSAPEFVQLNQRVPVRTIYLEAWPSHKGGLRILPDIYNRHDALRRKMGIQVHSADDPQDLSQFQTSIF